jgi:hypothetical protein
MATPKQKKALFETPLKTRKKHPETQELNWGVGVLGMGEALP